MKTLYAQGAYGRKADRADWENNKDFQACSTGQYFSIRDLALLQKMGYTQILFIAGGDRNRPVFTIRVKL